MRHRVLRTPAEEEEVDQYRRDLALDDILQEEDLVEERLQQLREQSRCQASDRGDPRHGQSR